VIGMNSEPSQYTSIRRRLEPLADSKTIILGIGNTLKSDDAVGPVICQQIAGKVSADVIDAGTVPENYINKIIRKKPQNMIVIDAVDFGGEPGAIKIFKSDQLSNIALSTHCLSPAMFIGMICSQISVNVLVIGIQPARTEFGRGFTVEVSQTAAELAMIIKKIFP